MGLAPSPGFPEKYSNTYEQKTGVNSARRGPLRFEEGIGTDTDAPNNFVEGAMQGYRTSPGHPNHNVNVYEKWPDETNRERAHVGSAAWTDSPTNLGDFASGTAEGNPDKYIYHEETRSGGRYERGNAATVRD